MKLFKSTLLMILLLTGLSLLLSACGGAMAAVAAKFRRQGQGRQRQGPPV